MTHRHAFRRGVAPRPSEKDLRLWGRLLKRAEAIGDCGAARAQAFTVAAEKAAKAIAPVGQQRVDSAFVQLVRVGQGFLRLSVDDRRAALARIVTLTADCRAVLNGGPGRPERPERKDIFG